MVSVIKTGLPIIADNGAQAAREGYISLLRDLAEVFHLKGMPVNIATLFEDYTVPEGVPISRLPDYVFIRYPQRPEPRDHDFAMAESLLKATVPQEQLGPANVLFNDDFTLMLGRVRRVLPGYGYGAILFRHDALRIYTMRCVPHAYRDIKPYSARRDYFLEDMASLVILAFYRPQYRPQLEKYRTAHAKIGRYLDSGYISYNKKHFAPITCFECKEAAYVELKTKDGMQDCRRQIPCGDCYGDWKARAPKTTAIVEKTVQSFQSFVQSKGWQIDAREVQGGLQFIFDEPATSGSITFYRTGNKQIQGALWHNKDIMQWLNQNFDEHWETETSEAELRSIF